MKRHHSRRSESADRWRSRRILCGHRVICKADGDARVQVCSIEHSLNAVGYSVNSIQCQVQFQHVDSRFAEQAERAAFGVLRNELANRLLVDAAGFCDASDLILGRRRADVRIEPAAGRGHQVDRHRARLVGMRLLHVLDAAANGVELRRIGRPEVAAGRRGAVVRRGAVADGRPQK